MGSLDLEGRVEPPTPAAPTSVLETLADHLTSAGTFPPSRLASDSDGVTTSHMSSFVSFPFFRL